MTQKIIIGITGASGAIYGIRAIKLLQDTDVETHLIISRAGRQTIEIETGIAPKDVEKMADYFYSPDEIAASVASGSFLNSGMAIAPCSIKTLSGIANSYADNLIIRAADVALKERRKLALMVRETPLHKGHLKLMTKAASLGAQIMPPVPAFYHKPETIEHLIDHTIGKLFDFLDIKHNLFKRWGGR